jgi:peptidoglycan/xylan/chitin deacetylase (PgdA/CDA1 family)
MRILVISVVAALVGTVYGVGFGFDSVPGSRASKPRALLRAESEVEAFDAYASYTKRPRQLALPEKLQHGNLKLKEVALTFDDGPHPQFTPQLLDLLRKYDIKATFFVVGKMAEKYPDLVKTEAEEGHVVGNHTYDHVNLTRIPQTQVQVEWQACSDVVKDILGKAPRYCRPPGGDFDGEVVAAAERCGLTTVLWTDDPGDYTSPGDGRIETRTLSRISNGGIILLHDGIQQTIDVLPQIIEHLQHRGYKFVTIPEMVKHLEKPQAEVK